jgi:hypothetical protein
VGTNNTREAPYLSANNAAVALDTGFGKSTSDTIAPCSSKRTATALPIPEQPPVRKQTLFSIPREELNNYNIKIRIIKKEK